MKFLIDADLPRSLIEIFRKYGYEAFDVRDVLGGVTDEEVYNYANKNNMVLVTRDLGFGDMYMVRGGYGLILVRLPYFFTAHQINRVLNTFLREVKPQEVRRSIIVVELGKYRIRKLK